MAHTFRSCFFHLIWSTKGRQLWITAEIKPRLYAYIGGIINNLGQTLLEIGGTDDHVHLLVQFYSVDRISDFIRDIKANSSLWLHKTFPAAKNFAWQGGYGIFSVSYSMVEKVKNYIQRQEEHHKRISFAGEYLQFLKNHSLKYDERFVLD